MRLPLGHRPLLSGWAEAPESWCETETERILHHRRINQSPPKKGGFRSRSPPTSPSSRTSPAGHLFPGPTSCAVAPHCLKQRGTTHLQARKSGKTDPRWKELAPLLPLRRHSSGKKTGLEPLWAFEPSPPVLRLLPRPPSCTKQANAKSLGH